MGWGPFRRGRRARRATPPPCAFVDLRQVAEAGGLGLEFDLRYARGGGANVFGAQLYEVESALLQSTAARRLMAAQEEAEGAGLSLLVFDAYRPFSVQQRMWELAPDPSFVARPRRDAKGRPLGGSDHNRGCAVDVGLCSRVLRGCTPLGMGSEFDDFTPAAYHSAENISAKEKGNRKRLRGIMERAGFVAYEHEWWHYHDPQCRARHPEVLDIPFEVALGSSSASG